MSLLVLVVFFTSNNNKYNFSQTGFHDFLPTNDTGLTSDLFSRFDINIICGKISPFCVKSSIFPLKLRRRST